MMRKAKLILPLALVIVVADRGGLDGGRRRRWQVADEGGLDVLRAACGDRDRAPAHDPDVMGVAEQVKDAAAKEAPDVAEPVISRSEKAGNITAEQADDLRAAAQGLADGKSPRELAPTVDLRDWDVRVVIRDAFEALQRARPRSRESDHRRGGRRAARSPSRRRPRSATRSRAGATVGAARASPNRAPAGDADLARTTVRRGGASLKGAGGRADLPRMRKLSLVVSLVSLVVLAVPAAAPAKGRQERRQGVQGAARPDGGRLVPCRVRRQAGQERPRPLRLGPAEGEEGRPQARPQGLPGEGPARQGDEALHPRRTLAEQTRLPSPPTTRTRSKECECRQGRGRRGLRRRVRRRLRAGFAQVRRR